MEKIIIYNNTDLKTFDDLVDIVSICYDPPEKRCECKHCYKYEIVFKIDKVGKIQ